MCFADLPKLKKAELSFDVPDVMTLYTKYKVWQ